ncbi:unnamed protein product [Trichobilharzia szidati]|nr:unnamed protein product [Trichobilharzia szidati]
MTESKPKLCFSFSQRKKQPILNPALKSTDEKSESKACKKEFITSIEDNIICSTTPKEEDIVIPLKRSRNNFRERMQKKFVTADPSDALTLQALRELKEESEAFKSKNQDIRIDYDIKIPIGSPEATEEADEADYDSVPIEKFGVALLAGMGFDPKSLDSSKKDVLLPQRPKGLGLGADPTAVQNAKQDVLTSKTEELTWTPGARCQIIFGKNKGLYGILEGVDGDTGRVVVRLKISKEVIGVLQHTVRLVSSKEYAVYSNCINQSEVDEYKAREAEQLSKKSDHDVDSNSSRVQSNGKHHQPHHDSRSRTLKNLDEDKPLKCEPRKPPGSTDWLRPKLIVRCLDRNYCSGKYNGEKVIVVTVNSNRCSCKTESGQIIEGLSTKYLQTFIPYEMNSVLMIVNGERSGQLARLIKRDSQNQMVDVKTRAGILLRYHFDSICAINDPFDD